MKNENSPPERENHSCLKLKWNKCIMVSGNGSWNGKKRTALVSLSSWGQGSAWLRGSLHQSGSPSLHQIVHVSMTRQTLLGGRKQRTMTHFPPLSQSSCENTMGPRGKYLGPREAKPQASSLFPSLERASGSLALHLPTCFESQKSFW